MFPALRLLYSIGGKLVQSVGGIAVTAVVSSWIGKLFDPSASTKGIDLAGSSEFIMRQLTITAVYTKYGESGVASLYRAGLISAGEFASILVQGWSAYDPEVDDSMVLSEENKAMGETGTSEWLKSFFTSSTSVADLSTDASTLKRMICHIKVSLEA